jgi:nucleotide-binding universal stress UspA family protein
VADRLMRQSAAPVLLVRPQDTRPDIAAEPALKRLLVPLDGSPQAEQILPHACALAGLMQAELALIQAAELALASTELYGSEFDSSFQERVQARAQRYLDGVAASLRAEGFNVSTKVVLGWPAQHILEDARDYEVDAIALATHGHGGMARLMLGSVSDKIVRGATASVLLYRPHEG